MCHVALKKKKRARVLKMGGKKCRRKTLRAEGILITNKKNEKENYKNKKEEKNMKTCEHIWHTSDIR